jgi:hypothetical protein
LAAAILASSVRPTTRGTINAASTPRIVITTMISIKVKPPLRAPLVSARMPPEGECDGFGAEATIAKRRAGNCKEERTRVIGVIRPLANAVENLKISVERLEVPRFSTRTTEGARDIINANRLPHPPERGCFTD